NHTHQVAQSVARESRVLYVDNDPIVRRLCCPFRSGYSAAQVALARYRQENGLLREFCDWSRWVKGPGRAGRAGM
ncbi:MAG TPA: SAM-dependent methyltransferase, partial [Streptosporangiaceae bacterium]